MDLHFVKSRFDERRTSWAWRQVKHRHFLTVAKKKLLHQLHGCLCAHARSSEKPKVKSLSLKDHRSVTKMK